MSANCPCEQRLSQQESVEIGERGGGGKEEQEQERTLEGLFLWVTVLLVLSPFVPLIENQTKKKLSLFTPVSPISLSHSTPFFHSPSILVFIENPFLCLLLVAMLHHEMEKAIIFRFLHISRKLLIMCYCCNIISWRQMQECFLNWATSVHIISSW